MPFSESFDQQLSDFDCSKVYFAKMYFMCIFTMCYCPKFIFVYRAYVSSKLCEFIHHHHPRVSHVGV